MSIYIHLTLSSSRGVVATGIRVVVHERHHNTCVPSLVLDVLHVDWVWECDISNGPRVFVLGLIEDDRAAIRDLSVSNDFVDMTSIVICSVQVERVRGPQICRDPL